jgi:uracil-DNA glycosylase
MPLLILRICKPVRFAQQDLRQRQRRRRTVRGLCSKGKALPRILIAVQASGARVHQSGRPFTDPSGDRLRTWMGIGEDIFYDPAQVAILQMAFCFPGYDAKVAYYTNSRNH